jgi:[CysO sulfur-carrier protein]-S-L-cysteine hydrolase
MLRLSETAYLQMIGHAFDCLPEEACGLMAGVYGGEQAPRFYPCRNEAASSKVYTVDTRDHLAAERSAEALGFDIVGVMHSHTHTDAYPSPTDVRQAVDPSWHYVIVSLKDDAPVLRSFRMVDGNISEERVVLDRG